MSNVPNLTPGQDEIVVELTLRRADPVNPGGDGVSDLGLVLGSPPPAHIVDAMLLICSHFGMDPAVSYARVSSVTDVEGGTDPATLNQLIDFVSTTDPAPEGDPEETPAPE